MTSQVQNRWFAIDNIQLLKQLAFFVKYDCLDGSSKAIFLPENEGEAARGQPQNHLGRGQKRYTMEKVATVL
jgi:hypothetical protein